MGRKAFERRYEVTELQLAQQVQEILNEEDQSSEEDEQGL
jgi:hypothetical protein